MAARGLWLGAFYLRIDRGSGFIAPFTGKST
jgi:hypothetical protein